MKLIITKATILLTSVITVITLVNWKVKGGYIVKFTGAPEGYFTGLKATILFDEANPEKSKITASIDATTLNTGNNEATAHAKEALATDKFPTINFESTVISKTGEGKYLSTGNLTLKGVTKTIKIPFTFYSKKNKSMLFPEIFKGQITIAPKDFGITKPGTPEQLTIELTIPVTQ